MIENGKYRTVNLGESGYDAFQSFLFLKLQTMQGLIPGIIISYDGVNNGYVQGKRAFSHSREQQIIKTMKNQDRLGDDHYTMSLDHAFLKPLKVFVNTYVRTHGRDVEKNDSSVKNNIAGAVELLESWLSTKRLADQYRAMFIGILQPNAFTGKPKIDYITYNKADSVRYAYYPYIFELLKEPRYKELAGCILDYTGKFDKDEFIYIDNSHVSPNGNRIIAESIYADIQKMMLK